jgi:hypothetical protein
LAENIAARIIEDDDLEPVPGIDGGNRVTADGATERDGTLPRNVREFQPVANFGGIPLVNPVDIPASYRSDGEPPARKRRGRPLGSTNRPRADREAEASLDLKSSLSNIEDLLVSIHWASAKMLDMSELELNAEDSRQLSRAIKECVKHYSFNIDPKKMALGNLLMVAGGIYAPRVMAIYKRGVGSETKTKTTPPVSAINERRTGTSAGPVRVPPPSVAPTKKPAQVPSELDMSMPIDGFDT